ncbi:hypothetical protein ABWK46_13150 [Peribacillus frigoritolerans]|uniref:hypothetical protein n=1 Tax=Peribacillus frigoritolerans TaxID=450367 RepID=UPI003399C611
MKKFNQVMKQLTQPPIFTTKEVGEPFICKCGEEVRNVEFVQPKGPLTGKIISAYQGCKCEDIQLAKDILQEREAKIEKVFQGFDSHSLINPQLKQATFENYQPTNQQLVQAKKDAMRYVEIFDRNEPRGIVITGPYGTGKSHISVSICKGLM